MPEAATMPPKLRTPVATLMDHCNRALTEEALTPEDRVATYVNRGILHLSAGDVAEADADFDRALALDPDQPDAWLNKAILHRPIWQAAPMRCRWSRRRSS